MPATVDAGDLLLCLFADDGGDAVTIPSGWTELFTTNNGTAVRFGAYTKIAAGDEDGTTVDFVTSGTEMAAAQVYRIQEGTWLGVLSKVEAGISATGVSANPDSPLLEPSSGGLDTLWIACYGADDDDNCSAYPTDYTDGTYTESGTANGSCSVASARRELDAKSDNPSAFTMAASEQWVANTIAIHPKLLSITARDDACASSYASGSESVTINVQEGDLVVVAIMTHDPDIYCSGVTDDIGNDYVVRTAITVNYASFVFAYVLSSVGTDATNEITATFEAGSARKNMIASSWAIDSGDTVTLDDASDNSSAWGESPWDTTANAINTTGDDELVIAAFQGYGETTYTNHEIPSGTAATVLTDSEYGETMFYRILAATLADGEAEVDPSATNYFVAECLAFKSEAAGGEEHALAGTIANSAAVDGAIVANRKLLGGFANTSSLSGSAILSRALSGSFANTAALSGNIFRTRLLSGDIASLSSLIASTLNRTRPISGSFDSQAALTGAIEKVLMFTGAFGATSALSGDIYLVSGLSGQIDIVSTVTGEVITIRGLSGDTGGLSAFSASLILGGEVTLSGDIIGDSTFSGPIYLTRRFSGNIDSLSALDGNLVAIRGLSGLVGAISDFSASLILGGEITLSGSVAGGSVFSGSVYLTRGISGSIDAISAISGDAIAVRMLSGIVDAVSDLSGNAILAKALAGIIDGVSILSGVLEPEEVAFGIVTITLAESKATITFTASKPDIAFSESKPRINFN